MMFRVESYGFYVTQSYNRCDATHRLDGLQQLDAKLLDVAMGVGELHKGLAGRRLGLPHADDGEHVPERCQRAPWLLISHLASRAHRHHTAATMCDSSANILKGNWKSDD